MINSLSKNYFRRLAVRYDISQPSQHDPIVGAASLNLVQSIFLAQYNMGLTSYSCGFCCFAVGADRFSLHPARFKLPFNYRDPILQALPATIIMQASLHMGTINVLAVFECDHVAFVHKI